LAAQLATHDSIVMSLEDVDPASRARVSGLSTIQPKAVQPLGREVAVAVGAAVVLEAVPVA
jgi:hypothetical protein